MPGHPLPTGSKPLPEDPEGPFPQAALVVRAQRLHQARPVAVLPDARLRATVVRSADSVWALLKLAAHASLALRLCHDPGGIAKVRRLAANGALKIAAEGSLGRYDILVSVCGEGTPILHCVTTFTPARAVLLAAGSRDLFPLPGTGDPTVVQGKVHSTQKGCEAGFAFFTVTQPEGGSAFYLQNFSALNDYWEATGTEPKESVGAEWPELGFRRPVSDAKPLAAGRRYVISDSYLVTDPRMPNKEYGIADMFLEALAKVYLVLPRPKAAYYDWPGAAKLTLRALNRCRPCQRHIKGRLYFNAYVGSSYKPPESMVHCALL
ncbi:MAG TPA: hypothetical protein VD994_05535, partial [Prosthecobacter sp.]|nr:hypothetical protein [Prosthecobacter sp.]